MTRETHLIDDTCAATRHDTRAAYNHDGCRCPDAYRAHNRYQNLRRRAVDHGLTYRVNATTARHQLQGLAALGWSIQATADRVHCDRTVISDVRSGRNQKIHWSIAARITNVYDDLRDMPSGDRRTATWAAKHGWATPPPRPSSRIRPGSVPDEQDADLDRDVDWVAVERFVNGDNQIRLNRDERWSAYRRLIGLGITHNQAAVRCALSGTTATLWRERYDQQEAMSA